jgi:hypothetical protein
MHLTNIFYYLAFSFSLIQLPVSAHPVKPVPVTLPLQSRVLYEYPDPTWVENIAVRSNGNLLLSLLSIPEIYLLDPFSGKPPVLVHSFTGYLGVLGIAEPIPDLFHIVAGNFSTASSSITGDTGPGSYSLFSVDLRNCHHDGTKFSTPAKVKKVLDIPQASFLNSLIFISPTVFLVSDSALGVVFRIDLATKTSTIILDYPEMKPHTGTGKLKLGINGIKLRGNYLYFINSQAFTFNRVPITNTGHAIHGAKVEILTQNTFGDDFEFGPGNEDNAWICENLWNRISVVESGMGNATVVLGMTDRLTVPGPTAARFGRTKKDDKILYVVSSGGLAAPINGTLTVGGKVLAVDTSTWS